MSKGSSNKSDHRWVSRQVTDDLRRSIGDGTLGFGARLPSYRELASAYGIALNTAREAVRQLAAEGHVVVEHGRGAFVRHHAPMMRFSGDRYSSSKGGSPPSTPFRDECERLGRVARVDVLAITRVSPPREVAKRLGVSSNRKSVARRYSCYYADDVPVQLVTAYVAWDDANGTAILQPNTGPGGIYARLAERGHLMNRSRDEISARMPRVDEAELLRLPAGTPVLDVLHTGFDQHDKSFEVIYFVMRGDESIVSIDQLVT